MPIEGRLVDCLGCAESFNGMGRRHADIDDEKLGLVFAGGL